MFLRKKDFYKIIKRNLIMYVCEERLEGSEKIYNAHTMLKLYFQMNKKKLRTSYTKRRLIF